MAVAAISLLRRHPLLATSVSSQSESARSGTAASAGSVCTFIRAAQFKELHQDEGTKVLTAARKLLDDQQVAYEDHIFVGDPAETITRFAKEQGSDDIIIGTRGLSALSSLLIGSVATKIIHLSSVPVVLAK